MEVLHSVAQHRGAAHPICFNDEVMEHEFPDGFKPINIESYDGTTDPAVWIEDFLLHIHMCDTQNFIWLFFQNLLLDLRRVFKFSSKELSLSKNFFYDKYFCLGSSKT